MITKISWSIVKLKLDDYETVLISMYILLQIIILHLNVRLQTITNNVIEYKLPLSSGTVLGALSTHSQHTHILPVNWLTED